MKTILGCCIFLLIILSGLAIADETEHRQQAHGDLTVKSIIVPLGIATLILLFSTLTLGFSMPKNRKLILPWHRKLAIMTILVAIIHATFVLVFH